MVCGLTIKQLTDAVGGGVTPRMVRHYHQLGLLPAPVRSTSNYRLYSEQDIQRLRRIVALKQQGFQLAHIRQLLETPSDDHTNPLIDQFQRQYQTLLQQMTQLRRTASALERLLGRDPICQATQAEALAHLKRLEAETQDGLGDLEQIWQTLDAAIPSHPEAFEESLRHLLPDLSDRSEIEVDLLSRLVLAIGDVSLVSFVRLSSDAIAASRSALKSGCSIVVDVPTVAAALDQPRLVHLGCSTKLLIDDPHITNVVEAEQSFWQQAGQPLAQNLLSTMPPEAIWVVGYAPSALLSLCEAIQSGRLKPALVIGMPIGFSHAPAAKRRLMQLDIPFVTIEGTLGGGLLAATALNALVESLIEKPNCHCYLQQRGSAQPSRFQA